MWRNDCRIVQGKDVTESIEELLKKSAKLCKQLSIDLPSYGQKQERGLFQEHRLLKEQVMKQQAMVDERLSEVTIFNLQSQITETCLLY